MTMPNHGVVGPMRQTAPHSPIAAPIRAKGAANTALCVAANRASRPLALSASVMALDGVFANSTGVVTNRTMVRPAARRATTNPNTTLITRPSMSAP